MAAGCILHTTRESKMEIPFEKLPVQRRTFMNSLPQSPRKSAKLLAMLGIGLLPSLPLLAQPIPIPPSEQSPVNISRSSTLPIPNPPRIDFSYGIVNVTLKNTYGKEDEPLAAS